MTVTFRQYHNKLKTVQEINEKGERYDRKIVARRLGLFLVEIHENESNDGYICSIGYSLCNRSGGDRFNKKSALELCGNRIASERYNFDIYDPESLKDLYNRVPHTMHSTLDSIVNRCRKIISKISAYEKSEENAHTLFENISEKTSFNPEKINLRNPYKSYANNT